MQLAPTYICLSVYMCLYFSLFVSIIFSSIRVIDLSIVLPHNIYAFRSREVLELIAKVLVFNEEQLVAVGLRVPPINLFASLINTVIPIPDKPVEVEV